MRVVEIEPTLAGWRAQARALLADGVRPDEVMWETRGGEGNLFGDDAEAAGGATVEMRVSKGFLETAKLVACHRGTERWGLLYEAVFRTVAGGERRLMEWAAEPLVRTLGRMAKAVSRDRHKMKAFVRFRKIDENGAGGRERFAAWYEPDHEIVELTAGFFTKRFASMDWSILTPGRCAHWDGERLRYTDGVGKEAAPEGDVLEAFWKTYYANIFNPARVKLGAMRAEMPMKFWKNLPEAALIPELTAKAAGRVGEMVGRGVNLERGHVSAKRPAGAPVPEGCDEVEDGRAPARPDEMGLAEVGEALSCCRACPLWEGATQAVVGEGPETAAVMLVGEQPGDEEDVAGRPFVGPAGKVLDRAMAAAGMERGEVYLTNAVKHFKWKPAARGKRRLHAKANAAEVVTCRPWLVAELLRVRPKVIVALGATAAGSLLGRPVKVRAERGWAEVVAEAPGARVVVTTHPSTVLRSRDACEQEEAFEALVEDLRLALSGCGKEG